MAHTITSFNALFMDDVYDPKVADLAMESGDQGHQLRNLLIYRR